MRLRSLELYHFRNHAGVALDFEAPIQFFVGANAQGKTNLVEAIYVLATGRSFRRAAQARDLVMHGGDEAAVRGEVESEGMRTRLEVRVGKQRRLIVNGHDVHLLREYVRHLGVVAFHPEDLAIVRGGPDLRRDFVDRAAFTLYPAYLDDYLRYQRALGERNQLLKSGGTRAELAAWTEELAVTGAALAVARHEFLAAFVPEALTSFGEIFGGVPLSVAYEPSPRSLLEAPASAWKARLFEEFEAREPDDRHRGFTTVGPHRDDVGIELDGKEARVYASQGQTRALALAFRVAQIRNAARVVGAHPLFILDDVGSELDEQRRAYLGEFLASSRVQAFITATERSLLPPLESAAETWTVAGGRIAKA